MDFNHRLSVVVGGIAVHERNERPRAVPRAAAAGASAAPRARRRPLPAPAHALRRARARRALRADMRRVRAGERNE